jgi:uncharacterized protein (DUF433 family)
MATATSWISKKPGRCGGEACVRDTRITVWGLEAYRRLGLSDQEILHAVDGLSSGDLEAAWDYVTRNSAEIDEAIRQNGAAEAGPGD